SRLLQKHLYYAQFIRPETEKHRPDRIVETLVHERLPLIFRILVPHPLLIVLLPVGLLGLTTLPRVVVWSVLPLLAGAYTLFAFLLGHYLVMWAPPLILMLVLAAAVAQRWGKSARAIVCLLLL